MKTFNLLTALIASLFIFQACSPSSTVRVVEEEPRTAADTITTEADTEEDYQELRIGVIDPVTNLDPLFADNLSTLRVLSLIYDGLFALNSDGEPEPALASDVEISDDGTEYRITLNRDIYYHNSSAFASGVGRRIHASDVKWAFERAATIQVPDHAANLLKQVTGFENYHIEQHRMLDTDKRVLSGVEGIRVVDAETVEFYLIEEDPEFLHKLASPYLSIYPREAVGNNGTNLKSEPVGTGPYILNNASTENQLIFTQQQNGNDSQTTRSPRVNRIEVFMFDNESDLFQEFSREELDWIPEAGPLTLEQVTTEDFELLESYQENLDYNVGEASRNLLFYINDEYRGDGLDWLESRLLQISENHFDIPEYVSLNTEQWEVAENIGEPDTTYFAPATHDLYARNVYSALSGNYLQPESSMAFYDILIATPQIILYDQSSDSMHESWMKIPTDYWLKVQLPVTSLSQKYVRGVTHSSVPWQLFIENIRVERESS